MDDRKGHSQAFSIFLDLPNDLRWTVWDMAMAGLRTVEIRGLGLSGSMAHIFNADSLSHIPAKPQWPSNIESNQVVILAMPIYFLSMVWFEALPRWDDGRVALYTLPNIKCMPRVRAFEELVSASFSPVNITNCTRLLSSGVWFSTPDL